MSKSTNPYRQLEDRTTAFAKNIIQLCNGLPGNRINFPLVDQIIRSAGSVGANYREANEAISKKDFHHRLRITRKEAKETRYWLDLILEANPDQEQSVKKLAEEADELRNIFSAILHKTTIRG